MRGEPRKHKRDTISFYHGKLGHGAIFPALCFDRASKDQTIGAGNCFEALVLPAFSHRRLDVPVIEADDQFHSHRDFAAQTFNDADDFRILAARRHKIDQAHCAICCQRSRRNLPARQLAYR